MILKRILCMISGALLVVLGIQLIIADYGDFGVIAATLLIIGGGTLLFLDFFNKSSGRRNDNMGRNTATHDGELYEEAEDEIDEDTKETGEELKDIDEDIEEDTDEKFEETAASSNAKTNIGWMGMIVLLILCVGLSASGLLGNWLSPEKELSQGSFYETFRDASVIEMRGVLDSSNSFTYLYVNDERVGTAKSKGFWNMKWLFMNKREPLYSFTYSDHIPNADLFNVYEFMDQNGAIVGYSQEDTVDSQHMLYFYNADDEPMGYVNIEPAWGFYRSSWEVYTMENMLAYRVNAVYDTVSKQLSYFIMKVGESDINVLQVMALNYKTRNEIKKYYD